MDTCFDKEDSVKSTNSNTSWRGSPPLSSRTSLRTSAKLWQEQGSDRSIISSEEQLRRSRLSPLQRHGYYILESKTFEHGMALVVCLNFVVVIIETDKSAKDNKIPVWVEVLSWSLLTTFILEIMLQLYTLRSRFHHDKWNIFDVIIIGTDLIMSLIGLFNDGLMNISQLRILRLTRIARAAKLIQAFPELRLMLAGLAGAVNAIFWGTLLLILTVIVWSVVAVQFIQPLNVDVFSNGLDREIGCERCVRAYESTFQATLTFWTQIVTGDSWGRETVPIIEKYPWTAIYFTGVYLSVGLALLNLILGVVVNIATEERERIQQLMLEEKKMDRRGAHDELLEMCEAQFGDGSAELRIEDIKRMYNSNNVFRGLMDRMDIGEEDLDVVWTILDSDKSGTLTKKEFATQIYKLKDSDTQFLLGYVRYYLSQIQDCLVEGQAKLKKDLRAGQDMLKQNVIQNIQRVTSVQSVESVGLKRVVVEAHEEVLLNDSNKSRRSIFSSEKASTIPRLCGLPEMAGSSGSLQVLYEQTQTLRVELEAAVLSGLSARMYPDCLAELHNIAWQSLSSIDDLHQQHTVVANILASQARCLSSVIKNLQQPESGFVLSVQSNGLSDHATRQAI